MHIDGFLNFRIAGIDLNIEEIIQTLNIIPTISYKKGDKYIDKKSRVFVYNEDCIISDFRISDEQDLEQAIDKLIEMYLPYSEYIYKLSKQYAVTFWLSLYPDTEQFSIHLKNKTINQLQNLGVDIDISFTFLKYFYDGN